MHAGQSSALPGLPLSAPCQQDLPAGGGEQAHALSPSPAAHSPHPRTISGASRRRALQLRRASRRYRQRLKAERRDAGLTTRGTPRKYQLRPELRGLHGSARKAALLRLHRLIRVEQGLTIRGTPRKNRAPFPSDQRPLARSRNAAAYYQRRREAFLALGLTAQGRTRVRRLSTIPTAQERAWRELRATMAIPANDFLSSTQRSQSL